MIVFTELFHFFTIPDGILDIMAEAICTLPSFISVRSKVVLEISIAIEF